MLMPKNTVLLFHSHGLIREGATVCGVQVRNYRRNSALHAPVAVNAAGIWGNIAEYADLRIAYPGERSLIADHRINQHVINRKPSTPIFWCLAIPYR